ncbi:protein-S-isoprenylcysteine methyltransferase, partial [Xanthomonas citri pv. citri]|nr:protein-S-isoprenylcysteine methyltransferase [Xanthomonas citri pv. citri]
MSASSLFLALNLLWGGYELLLSRRRRAGDGGAHDQGTLQHLWRVLSAAVAVAVALVYSGLAHWPQGWGAPLQWAGCALIG